MLTREELIERLSTLGLEVIELQGQAREVGGHNVAAELDGALNAIKRARQGLQPSCPERELDDRVAERDAQRWPGGPPRSGPGLVERCSR